ISQPIGTIWVKTSGVTPRLDKKIGSSPMAKPQLATATGRKRSSGGGRKRWAGWVLRRLSFFAIWAEKKFQPCRNTNGCGLRGQNPNVGGFGKCAATNFCPFHKRKLPMRKRLKVFESVREFGELRKENFYATTSN